MNTNTLVVITGPTAVGKTDLCVSIAKHFNCEIINADSRQFFKELSIGTAKPTKEEMDGVKHHFVDCFSISKEYNANHFEQDVLALLPELFEKNNIVILTGGSGMYMDAVCNGFDSELPSSDEELRDELEQIYHKYGIEILQEKLRQLDPVFYQEVDLSNINRLYRAIEVCILAKTPYSSLRKGIHQKRPFNVIKIGLNRDRDELFDRINRRVDNMMNDGLLYEVESVIKDREHNALKTVGYRELFEYIDGNCELEFAIEKIKTNTRRYAKRQLVWLNRTNDYKWFNPTNKQEIISFISNSIDHGNSSNCPRKNNSNCKLYYRNWINNSFCFKQ